MFRSMPMTKPLTSPASRHPDEAPAGKTLITGLLVGLFVVAAFAGGRYLAGRMAGGVAAPEAAPVLPPEPRLQVDEPGDWQKELALQRSRIEGYAWVDQAAGVVRIPVERAMELVAQRGLPARPPAKADP